MTDEEGQSCSPWPPPDPDAGRRSPPPAANSTSTSTTSTNSTNNSPSENEPTNERASGPRPSALLAAGIGVFTICSLVQGAAGTSMFETSAPQPDNFLLEILVQVTWWPGWIVSLTLVGFGVSEWWKRRQQA